MVLSRLGVDHSSEAFHCVCGKGRGGGWKLWTVGGWGGSLWQTDLSELCRCLVDQGRAARECVLPDEMHRRSQCKGQFTPEASALRLLWGPRPFQPVRVHKG